MRHCDCTRGGPCTKTTVCAIESAVEDATAMKDEVIEMAKAWVDLELSSGIPITKGVRRMVRQTLIEAVSNYEEWEQSL